MHYFPGYKETVLFLIENGANVNSKCDIGRTPLHVAAEIATFLIDKRAQIDVRDKDGATPLHIAAHYGNFKF